MRMNIEAERSRLGYTKAEVSEKLNITQNTYNRYLRGGDIPSDVLVKMASMFHCTTDYLLGLSTKPT